MIQFSIRYVRFTILLCAAITMMFAANSNGVHAQLIVGHRGASYDAPENTLAAFKLAFEQGADGVEGDFRLTADKRIVCIHDDTTERVSNQNISVANSKLCELQSLDVGSWKAESFSSQRVPTIEQVIECIPPGKKFFIELKTGPEIVEPLKAILMDAAGKRLIELDQCVVISFKESTILKCKQLIPKLEAQWLTGFKQQEASSADAPAWKPDVDAILKSLNSCEADGIGCEANTKAFDASTIERLRRENVSKFHVWTVDDPEKARLYQSLGALGITTNRPKLIREQLEARPVLPLGR